MRSTKAVQAETARPVDARDSAEPPADLEDLREESRSLGAHAFFRAGEEDPYPDGAPTANPTDQGDWAEDMRQWIEMTKGG